MIPESEIWELIQGALLFPYPKICKHSVILDLLELVEQYGGVTNKELVDAVVRADDETALALLPMNGRLPLPHGSHGAKQGA